MANKQKAKELIGEKTKMQLLEQFDKIMLTVVAPNEWFGVEYECSCENFNLKEEILSEINKLQGKADALKNVLNDLPDEEIGYDDLLKYAEENEAEQ